MTTRHEPPRRESVFMLGRRLVQGGIQLAKLEVTRGRQEVGERIGRTIGGAIMFAIAAGFGLLSLIALVNLIIALIALLVPTWLAALIALVLFVVLGAIFAWLGSRRITSPVPEETIASVKEDVAWAKRLLRRE